MSQLSPLDDVSSAMHDYKNFEDERTPVENRNAIIDIIARINAQIDALGTSVEPPEAAVVVKQSLTESVDKLVEMLEEPAGRRRDNLFSKAVDRVDTASGYAAGRFV